MRIGLVISNDVIKKYEVKELYNLFNSNYEISYVFSERKDSNKKIKILEIFKSIINNKFFFLIYLEQKISSYIKNRYSYFEKLKEIEKKVNIFKEFPDMNNIPKKKFVCLKVNKKYSFDLEMREIIKKNCDILVLLGFNKVLDADVLNITKFGTLSFHTSNTNKYRGRPAAFHEFINDEKYGGVTLQLLSEEIDFGFIVNQKTIEIGNARSLDETLYKMMNLKNDMLLEGLKKIEKKQKFYKPSNESKYSTVASSRKFYKVFICLKKTINKRYFNR